jgi:hypothetical protein
MEINIEELKEWNRNSKRGINREIDSMKERLVQFYDYAKATEIHNHFESGCSAQVFNDKVTGKFTKKNRWKKKEKEKKRLW